MIVEIIKDDIPGIAEVRGFLFWKKIYINRGFFNCSKIPSKTKCALIAHEIVHAKQFHTEQRILCLLFLPFFFFWLCRKQELWCDNLIGRLGLGRYFLPIIADDVKRVRIYPSHAERRKNLEKYA